MELPQNNILSQQVLDENKRLLRARHRNYRPAKVIQGILILCSVLLPLLSLIGATYFPEVRPYVALAALILLLVDTAFIDGFHKGRLKRGAKLQEQFDTKVFSLPWNRFVTGAHVEPEDVHSLSTKPLSEKREQHFNAWHEVCVGSLPLHLARLVCQRTNISYDARLRRKYGNWLLALTVLFGVALLFFGMSRGFTLADLVMTLLVPIMPAMTWALKERLQQTNAAVSLTNLVAEWNKIWTKALDGADPADITADSRALQDAIYQHRERSPLVFDWVYHMQRKGNESAAHHAAEHLVATAEKRLREGDPA